MHVLSYCASSSRIAVSIEAGSEACRRHNFEILYADRSTAVGKIYLLTTCELLHLG